MWLSTFSQQQREAMLRLAHNVIVSDGLLDPNEEGMLESFRREMGVAADFEVEYLDLPGVEGVFPDRRSRMIVLVNLCKLSYADGAFEIEEECLINEIRKACAVSEGHFSMLENWTKRLMALEAEGETLLDLV